MDFLDRHHVDRCFLGAAGLSDHGVSEALPGFEAIKKVMMRQSAHRHFLIDASKFGRTYLNIVGDLMEMGELVTDATPDRGLAARLKEAAVLIKYA